MVLEFAPGRYPFPLSDRWILVVLVPVPGVVVLGLFLDGEIVELVDDPLDVLGYLRLGRLPARVASSRPATSPGWCWRAQGRRARGRRRHPGGAGELEAGDVHG